jgi:hypothetical protein
MLLEVWGGCGLWSNPFMMPNGWVLVHNSPLACMWKICWRAHNLQEYGYTSQIVDHICWDNMLWKVWGECGMWSHPFLMPNGWVMHKNPPLACISKTANNYTVCKNMATQPMSFIMYAKIICCWKCEEGVGCGPTHFCCQMGELCTKIHPLHACKNVVDEHAICKNMATQAI